MPFWVTGLLLLGLPMCGAGSGRRSWFGPFDSQSYLTPTGTPFNSVNVNWNTAVLDSTVLAYGRTPSLGETIRLAGPRNYHHVMIQGLQPDQEYYYRILPGGQVKRFRTFPVDGDSFDFLVIGDTRTDSAAHQSVIDRMASFSGRFVIHCGDLVEAGDNDSMWRIFFDIEDTLLATRQFLPTIGNHDAPYWPYDTLFPLPDSEEYYSVDYGSLHIVALNTETDLAGPQRAWLEQDLTRAREDQRIDWIVVAFHRPPYSSGSHGSQLDVRDAWCHLFETHRVDLVLAGHDHFYERTWPINGVVYVISGGGGAPLCSHGFNEWTAYNRSSFQFGHVEVRGRQLTWRAIRPDGAILDSVVIDKRRARRDGRRDRSQHQLKVFPCPMRQEVAIDLKLEAPEEVRISIVDCVGCETAVLKDGGEPAGVCRVNWDGRDRRGRPSDDGVYFVVVKRATGSWIRKVVRIAGD